MIIAHGLSSGQVLQRAGKFARVEISGSCETSGPMLATLSKGARPLPRWKNVAVGRAKGGKFTAALAKLPTGGSYKLKLSVGKEALEVRELFVGDVWLMAGQSNMQGIGNLDGAAKPHPLARCLCMDGVWRKAEEPLHLMAASIDPVHSGAAPTPFAEAFKAARKRGKGAGVGLFFAREMLARTRGVPQGLLACAHGGTSMAQWDPAKKDRGGRSLYGSMLRAWRSTGQPVAGVLWYQGESDCNAEWAPQYTANIKRFIGEVRRDLKQPKLPFLLVQLGGLARENGEAARHWTSVREQQRQLAGKLVNVAVVPAIGLPLDDSIHIGADGFPELARRLARQASRLVHGDKKERPEPGPVKAQAVCSRFATPKNFDAVRVRFAHAVGGLRAKGNPAGFALVKMDGTLFHDFFRIELEKDAATVLCSSPLTDEMVGIAYGAGLNPYCNIIDARGAALPAFGPLYITRRLRAVTPFLPVCDASAVQPPTPRGIAELSFPARGSLPAHKLESNGIPGFMDEHLRWEGKSGWAAFHFAVECPEAMPVKLLVGYDGPFRFALNGKELLRDLAGTNPAVADKKCIPMHIEPGRHEACVLMDLNQGNAWGFWFRVERTDIPPQRIMARDYAMPKLGP